MPPIKKPVSYKLKLLADEFIEDGLVHESKRLMCRYCGIQLGLDSDDDVKRWTIVQHIRAPKHIKNKMLQADQKKLTFEKDTYSMDICKVRTYVQIKYRFQHTFIA